MATGETKSILEMCQGAILERANYEMERIIDNVLDPNTKPNAKRKLTITLELIPSSDRKQITVNATAKCTLVPTEPVTTGLFITSQPGTGEMVVAELVPQIPGQMDVYGAEQEEPKILKFAKRA